MTQSKITWTITDEAPALATHALLPVLQAFTHGTGILIEEADISLAGRIIAAFPEKLSESQQLPDYLAQLGVAAQTPDANIIKLPNISASIPQLQTAVRELQQKGYNLPDFPENPSTDEEKKVRAGYAAVLGSAVNPVLREGNSDRRAAASVKRFAKKNPHKMMKPWPETGSKSRVAHMTEGDFYGSEKSLTVERSLHSRIVHTDESGTRTVLKSDFPLETGEIVDTAVMNVEALRAFYREQIDNAEEEGLLFSLHLKATMMKVSDPVMFGHCVSVFYEPALAKHTEALQKIGADVNNGLSGVLEKLSALPESLRNTIESDISAVYAHRPSLAMVDSRKGITNLHAPNNVIIDASMPNVVRDGGCMWNKDDVLQETLAVIPDRSYAVIYREIIEDCRRRGQFDPATMGSVSNVGLMAKKAEEYGSHDKTFVATANGTIALEDESGAVLIEQPVQVGDIFRMCQTKDGPIQDWVKLAVSRARDSKSPAIFWLDENRAHDAALIEKVQRYLKDHDTTGLDIQVLSPVTAMKHALDRIRRGEDTIAVTGNVLRDYLTDLFPILELGTSARMLSIVPLMNGGGLFETGAGGSAPKHVSQFLAEGHLRWDSLGEYCAVVPSLELIAKNTGSEDAAILAETLDTAIATYLENGRSPSRKVHEPDNRTATFYLTLYWAQALTAQTRSASLSARFAPVATDLKAKEETIVQELLAAQGHPVDIGGYYRPDVDQIRSAMRPSKTLNAALAPLMPR